MEKKVYTTADIQDILGCSKNKAYALLKQASNSKDMFKVMKVGAEYRIPIKSFDRWLEGDN